MASPSFAAEPSSRDESGVCIVPARLPQSAVATGRVPVHVHVASLLAILGVVSVWPTVLLLWSLWTTDPLKSIGAFVPVVSLLLTLRAWRALDWKIQGSWWGLVLLVATIAAVHLRDGAVLELVVTPAWSITLPPHSLVAFAYASGIALVVGGGRLWRAAWFPLVLMLLVNPVPHIFNRLVDLPLQHASAAVARGLAHGLGQGLTPDQLYLMFTPEFGMFIAPGCDGIRGSVTMGLIALVAGYLYRFRLRAWVAVVAGAVLLGYVFNLLRLCVLVLYYVVALHWRWLQGHAEGADYCIGATLFFFATMLLFAVVRRGNATGDLRWPAVQVRAGKPVNVERRELGSRRIAELAALGLVLLLGAAPYARGMLSRKPPSNARVRFPASVGAYQLRRTWPETLDTGQTIFDWAEYRLPGGAQTTISVGVSPVLGAHDTLLCHVARGEAWTWHGSLPLLTRKGVVGFSGTQFNDGTTQALEATTVCTGTTCGQWASERTHLGLVYSRPHAGDLVGSPVDRPVPVLLRVELPDPLLPTEVARKQLRHALESFSGSTSFDTFAYRYPRP